jgi:hypothetical protein
MHAAAIIGGIAGSVNRRRSVDDDAHELIGRAVARGCESAARKIAAVASSGTTTLTSTPVKAARIEARPILSIASTAILTGSGSAGGGAAVPPGNQVVRGRFSRLRRNFLLAAATFDKAVVKA